MTAQIVDSALITLIESYPILYDKDLSRGSKNAHKKDEAWRQVSLELGASERACITRWKSIRDRFGKEYRRVYEHPDEPVTWDVFPQLMFLKNHYKYGFAKNDELPDIKYEPRTRRRRKQKCRDLNECEESNNEDESLEEEEHYVTQRLIQLVKEYEVIYDKLKIRDSKNLTAKNEAWRQISERMGISEETCYQRWKKLRDRFSRECRNHHISPNQPVEWEYYNDLVFLEQHYRKGIPLNVDTIKRPGRPQKAAKAKLNTPEKICNTAESTFQCMELKQNTPDDMLEYEDIKNISYQEYPTEMLSEEVTKVELVNQSVIEDLPGCAPVEQLCAVIDNIEAVLQQSQDCLQSFREHQEKHKKELNNVASSSFSNSQPIIFQKMNVLLEGLSAENRSKAEVKIVKFLCECQIKTLNNEEIEDVKISYYN